MPNGLLYFHVLEGEINQFEFHMKSYVESTEIHLLGVTNFWLVSLKCVEILM